MQGLTLAQVIDRIIASEGGYVDHPADRGGPTKFGITEAVARAGGYHGQMQDLPESTARRIYTDRYFRAPGFDLVASYSTLLAVELTDTGVNMGPKTAIKFLQRCLNAFNNDPESDIVVDGIIGLGTLDALSHYLLRRGKDGEAVLVRAVDHLQGARYIELAELDKSQEAFTYGWIRARTGVY